MLYATAFLFPILMLFAAWMDLFTMRIANWISIVLTLAFLPIAFACGLRPGLIGQHYLCGLLILAPTFALFAFGKIGGGDAKLAASSAIWMGWGGLVDYLLVSSLLGGVLAIVILAARQVPLGAALSAYRQESTPNVIVLEVSDDRAAFLADLDALAEFCDDGTRVVVVGRANDISLYRALIARGVSEYLVEPFEILDFIRVVSELYAKSGSRVLGRIVAVYGARGGVGASTVAHHLAWSIATKAEISTVIADCDLPFGTAGLDFNQDPPQGIADAVFAPDRLDVNMLDRLMSKCNDRLVLLPAPATLERNYDFDAEAFDGVINLLRMSAPMIVLDLPNVWTAWSRRLLVSADEVVLVAAPDLANLRNVKNIQDNLAPARANDAKIKLVMNTVGVPKRPEIPVKDFSSSLNLEASLVIPFDAKLFGAAANNGQMVAEVSGGAKIGHLFEDFGRLLSGKPNLRKPKRGLLDGLKSPKLSFSLGKKS